MNRKGFTLIELMIVIAIIAIIAAIAIPGLLRARISANEGSAVGTMRTISTSQAQFQSNAVVDQNGNGTGEFGLLDEMTGQDSLRGTSVVANPTYLTKALSTTSDEWGSKSGYFYIVYLPGTTVVTDTAGAQVGAVAASASNASYQEVKWRGYAWPISAKSSGNRAFAIDQAGEVYATANLTGTAPVYSANTSAPFGAAVEGGTDAADMGEKNVQSGTGASGQIWKPAN